MHNRKLDYLELDLELAQQDLYDHDGSELTAAERIKEIETQIKELENGTN